MIKEKLKKLNLKFENVEIIIPIVIKIIDIFCLFSKDFLKIKI